MIVSLFVSLALAAASPKADPCQGSTTPAVNACLSAQLNSSKARLDKYLKAALDRHADEKEAAVRLGIQASQQAFEAYRTTECQAVYEDWKDGTIRGAMSLSCDIGLTDERTHDIWKHWLQYMDNEPPVLPEPKPRQ